jgi:hypothetical protein
MHFNISSTPAGVRVLKATVLALATFTSGAASADLVWDGNFNDHNFIKYHQPYDPYVVGFHLIPQYGRPPQYGYQPEPRHVGNGELLSLVDYPTRGSNYSAKFVVKSQAGGGIEPADCDPALACETRRANLQMTETFYDYYDAIPQGSERWVSISFFIPENFDSTGSGFGPVVWGSKANPEVRPGAFGITAEDNEWQFIHRYYGRDAKAQNYSFGSQWWIVDKYGSSFPASGDGHLVDLPDVSASRAAFANLNRGGWTDWVMHFRTDLDDFENNSGFLDVYMRADSGKWVHVVALRPVEDFARKTSWKTTDRNRLYDRGVGQVGPGGYTSQMGLYMDKGRVWGKDQNMVIYMDNHKVGDDNATFAEMSHDGSSPGKPAQQIESPPNPPIIVKNE